MKYFSPPKVGTSKGPQISVCMISRSCVLLVAPLLVCLVCLPLMQSTHSLPLVKSRFGTTPSFTNLLILSLEMCPSLLCHKKYESFAHALVLRLSCRVRCVS